MHLADFIRENTHQIVSEWERFARTLTPAAESMSPLALRDHIHEILDFICADIESAQTESEQINKSQGKKASFTASTAAEIHASLRHAGGFDMDQMVSEYRALRASIIQMWDKQLTEITRKDLLDITRFNESIDQALVESIAHYSKKLDYSRHLFLGILSHDLRSPLSTARMSAQLVLKMGAEQMNDRQTMLLSQITDCSDRAMDMVDYLLDLTQSRLGSGIPIIRKPMEMGFVSRQLIDEIRISHPDRIFNLKVTGNTEGEWDKPRMGQIFSNLLGNALQYGFTDTPITVMVTGREGEVNVSVHNEGTPIAPEFIHRIFGSLIRSEDSENSMASNNLGLGLYIIKEIVEAHKGTISVTSTEKEGTKFTVRLPRHSDQLELPKKNITHLSLVAN